MSRRTKIVFRCDVKGQPVQSSIFITGNLDELGGWVPNKVRMFDDGTNGDERPDDGVWTLEIAVSPDSEILYKYTNSGTRGSWVPGEEFSGDNRRVFVPGDAPEVIIVEDVFGRKNPE
jgi:hypothetical protein